MAGVKVVIVFKGESWSVSLRRMKTDVALKRYGSFERHEDAFALARTVMADEGAILLEVWQDGVWPRRRKS